MLKPIREILVGAGEWNGSQLNIVSIGSIDMCPFGGAQLSGYVEGNPVIVKIWRPSTQTEYETELSWSVGTGNFGDVIQSIDEITLIDPNACEDNNDIMAAFGGCAGAVAALGCDFVFAGAPISDNCPESCNNCDDQNVYGCTDTTACNYDSNATIDDNSCTYPDSENFDCDGNCIVELDVCRRMWW